MTVVTVVTVITVVTVATLVTKVTVVTKQLCTPKNLPKTYLPTYLCDSSYSSDSIDSSDSSDCSDSSDSSNIFFLLFSPKKISQKKIYNKNVCQKLFLTIGFFFSKKLISPKKTFFTKEKNFTRKLFSLLKKNLTQNHATSQQTRRGRPR